MSDPRRGNGSYLRATADFASKPTSQGPEGTSNTEPKPTTTGPSSFGSAKRGVRSTRTPAVWTKDADPHRSQTIPIPPSDPHSRRAPTSHSTLPTPNTRRRTTSGPPSQPSSQVPVLHEPNNALGGTDYIVEQLASSSLSGEPKDSTRLAPAGPSMPVPDTRHSGSSFQTEPSSYYSMEDNWSTGGPAPPMPDPKAAQQHALDNRYESLWLAAQAPSMSSPNAHPHPLPSPYDDEEGSGSVYTQEDDFGAPIARRGTSPSLAPRDLYDSSWLAGPSPGMPVPSAASPPMPSPATGQMGEKIPNADAQSSSHWPEYPQPSSHPENTSPDLSSTAPLRIHHHTRPTAGSPTSPASAPYSGRTSSRPNTQRVNFDQPNSGPPKTHLSQQPTPSATHTFSNQTKPVSSMPAITSLNSAQKPTPTHAQPNAHRVDSHPPQGSGSIQTKPVTSPPPGGSFNVSQKPTSTYAQHTTHRVDSQSQGSGPFKTQVPPISSVAPSGNRFETRPTAPSSTAPTTAPNKAAPVHSQPSSYRVESNQSTRPPGAAPSAFSTSAPPKTSTVQTQQANHNTRPQVTETHRPQIISAPQPQQHASTSTSKEKEKEQAAAKSAAKSAAITASTPTRPRFHGNPSQMDTQYVNMMLALDDIPTLHNIFAGFFNWILLAGFILFPGTFTSLHNLGPQAGTVGQALIDSVTELPLYIVAWVCCGIGACGMVWLWWRWRKNYLWGLNKIFIPGLMNSLAGLLSTVANIFGAQHGELSTTSKSTLIVVGASTGVFGIFTGFYMFWLVRRVKARHDSEVGKERAGKYGEGVVDLSKKKP